jgi:putative addiction module component (TIGR02574 family)
MAVIEISKLSKREKFQLMEALWEDMRLNADQMEIPQEHINLLDSRRRAVETGEDSIFEWDDVKHLLREK